MAQPRSTVPAATETLYALNRRQSINPSEVEVVGTRVVEVGVLWQGAILRVTHLAPSQSFSLVTENADDHTRLAVLG